MDNSEIAFHPVSFNESTVEQLRSSGKWAKFVAVVFIFFGTICAISLILFLANDKELMTQLVKINGMSDEMIESFENEGKSRMITSLSLMAITLLVGGILIFLFSIFGLRYIKSSNEQQLESSTKYLKYYLLFSFILGCITSFPTIYYLVTDFFKHN